jgi:hypothetical protein
MGRVGHVSWRMSSGQASVDGLKWDSQCQQNSPHEEHVGAGDASPGRPSTHGVVGGT